MPMAPHGPCPLGQPGTLRLEPGREGVDGRLRALQERHGRVTGGCRKESAGRCPTVEGYRTMAPVCARPRHPVIFEDPRIDRLPVWRGWCEPTLPSGLRVSARPVAGSVWLCGWQLA